jgi:DNA-binding LytR/AlgR family response regulator
MKIILKRQPSFGEAVITIECDQHDTSIDRIIEKIKTNDLELSGKKDGNHFVFSQHEVYYIESMEDQCLLYTKDDVYRCKYRLSEIEDTFDAFIRVNKQTVLNYRKIKIFKSTLNGKLEATLINGDRIEISRSYVQSLKSKLGGLSS